MKYSVNISYESESLEDDLSKVTDIVMGAVDKYYQIVKENKTQSDITDIQRTVHGLDNRIDGLEATIDSFKEVEDDKKTSEVKSKK